MSLSKETILVTGANGYIASWIVKYLLDSGARVRGTVRDAKSASKTEHLTSLPGAKERLELVSLNLTESKPLEFEACVQGCTMVLHTASPFPSSAPKDENEVIKPAVEGTMGIIRAIATASGSQVTRVVVTSSVVAVGTSTTEDKHVRGENDWTDLKTASPYPKSKTMAEQAARDFWNGLAEDKKTWSLTTIHPSLVMGPSLTKDVGTSVGYMVRLLSGEIPIAPNINFGVVDVRDVALAHILVLTKPIEAINGRRFILSQGEYGLVDLGRSLRKSFGELGYHPPTHKAPDFAIFLASFFSKEVASLWSNIGRLTRYDNKPSVEVLGVKYHDFDVTMKDGGSSLIVLGLVKKTSNFEKKMDDMWTPEKEMGNKLEI